MLDTMGDGTWSTRTKHLATTTTTATREATAVLELEVGAEERALLDEAMRLLGIKDPADVLRTALRELVERQRFLSWVAAHDRNERSGNA